MKRVDINVFYPGAAHEKQKLVKDDPARFKLVRCGRKFGKTKMLIGWLMERAIKNQCAYHGDKCPNKETGLKFPYVAPFRKQAKDIVWGDHVAQLLRHFDKEVGPGFYKKNESNLSITFPSGGTFQLFGAENPDALRGGSDWGAFALDEYDDWPEDTWELVIRFNLGTHKAPAIIAGTPKGKGGMYRKEMVEDSNGNRIWKSYHYPSSENPSLPEGELEQLIEEYKGYGEDYYNQEILAEYVKPIGVVYKEFSETKQVSSKVKYEPDLPLHVTWDFGVNDPTAIIWIQPDLEGNLRIIDYHEESNANLEHFVNVVNGKPYKKPSLHTGDIAGRARNLVTGQSIVDELKKNGIYVVTRPIPNIEEQVRKTHQIIPRLRVKAPDKGSNIEGNLNFSTARFVDVLNNYRYPKKNENLVVQKNEQPIHNQWSHGARALEYYAWNVGYTSGSYEDYGAEQAIELARDGTY